MAFYANSENSIPESPAYKVDGLPLHHGGDDGDCRTSARNGMVCSMVFSSVTR